MQGTFGGRNFGEDDDRKDVQSKFLQGKALPGSAAHPVCPQPVPVSDPRGEGCLVNARETLFFFSISKMLTYFSTGIFCNRTENGFFLFR